MPRKYANLCERITANTCMDLGAPWYNNTPCWLWLGPTNSRGYGRLCERRKKGPKKGRPVSRLVHRLALREFRGVKITARKGVVMHLCNTKRCCNPEHLLLGTHRQNMKHHYEGTLPAEEF